MDETNRDGWPIAVGLAYPVVAFGVLLGCGGAMGPLAFHPLAVPRKFIGFKMKQTNDLRREKTIETQIRLIFQSA